MYMTENTKEKTKLSYQASEIPTLLGPTTPSLSTFYRYVENGEIRKIENEDQSNPAYVGEDVRRFLKGELSRKKSGTKQEKPSGPGIKRRKPAIGMPIIDYARGISDLSHTFVMEADVLDENALLPSAPSAWIKKNKYAYWFLSHPKARDDVWATLAVLSLPEEQIFRLLKGEIALQDVTSDDVLAYNPEQSPFSCYMSAVVKPGHEDALLKLLQRVFAFWCEEIPPVQIDKLYISVPSGIKGTPLHQLVKKFYFSPLPHLSNPPHQTAWVLDFTFYNPAEEIQKIQTCFQAGKPESDFAQQEPATSV
jgi:hypothetical protein